MAVLVPRMPTFSSFLYAASTHISNETLCTDNALYLHYLKLFFYAVQNFIAVGHELYPISTLSALSERSLGSWKLNSGTLFQSHHSMLLCLTRQNWKKKMTPIYFYRHFITSVLAHATRLLWLASVVKHAYASQWLLNTPEEAHVRAWKIQWRQVSTGINVSVGQSCQIRLLSTGI